MQAYLLFIVLTALTCSSYLFWPSRYNVIQHLSVGFCIISFFVPVVILRVQDDYSTEVVDLYFRILLIGFIFLFIGSLIGFNTKKIKINYTFNVINEEEYEQRVIKLTYMFLILGTIGLALSYAGMGFVPAFAADPISAKLFRNEYQAPYMRVAVLFRSSFYILTGVYTLGCIIWYKTRKFSLLVLLIISLILLILSLQRGPAFGGIMFAFIIIMSLKSRLHFAIVMVVIIVTYLASSVFYIVIGAKTLGDDQTAAKLIEASAPDVSDELHFLEMFNLNPEWTYGRTIYGGLIPGHYEWNPAVYTLRVINPGADINTLGSGGLRLPLPMWGYVAFQWPGVILFCLPTGFLGGYTFRYLKDWFYQYPSIIVRTSIIGVYAVVFGTIVGFTALSFSSIPPIIIMLFYMYRIRWKFN